MSYRLRRKSRPQGDVEIYGGPLKQKRFDGGMNIDVPASEIKSNEVAYAENVLFREFGVEARAGTVKYNSNIWVSLNSARVYGYSYNPASYTGSYMNFRHTMNYDGAIRSYSDVPSGTFIDSIELDGIGSSGTYNAGTGDCTMIPFRRGWLTFTASKISYTDPLGSFQINAPNPVHGMKDSGSGTFKYRYLFTLSRILTFTTDPTSAAIAADRQAANAEVVHESGTNGARYRDTGPVSTARDRDYGEILTSSAIAVGAGFAITNANLTSAFSSTGSPDSTAGGAATHFTHVSIYRTMDIGTAGLALGNAKTVYVWVADVKKTDIGSTFTDTISDEVLGNRIASKKLVLKKQGYDPMPSGSCAEVAGGWMFVSDRSNATPENYLHYCSVSDAEDVGYYFKDYQKQRFNDGIRALRATQDLLSIFCNNSSHICNMTSYSSDTSKLQLVPVLNYFHAVDRTLGIKDWATLDAIDENSMIAVCSDGSVRVWDTTKWGDDLAYEKVSSEVKKIVPASPYTYARGSVGKFYNGAYYLWYSKDTADTATTKCLRYGFGSRAGFGWSYYTGWIYPPFKTGAQVIVDNIGVQRLIVLSASAGASFYWAETYRPFTGALDNYDQIGGGNSYQLDRFDTDAATYVSAGTEIASTWKFRDLIGNEEADTLVHDETYLRWRPYTEGVAYRTAFSISLSAYKDGSTTAAETVTSRPRTEAIKFQAEIAARRVQLGVNVAAGGWKFTGVDSHFRSLDRINFAVAADNSSSESTTGYAQYQAELAQDMTHWVTRRETSIDRASAGNLTAAGTITLITGPDSKSSSALNFYLDSAAYTRIAANAYAGNFTASFWTYNPPANLDVFRILGTNPFYIRFTNSTTMSVAGLGTVTVASTASGWNHWVVKRSGTTITVIQNGVTKGTVTDNPATSLGGGNFSMGYGTGVGGIFDLRIYTKALSAGSIAYYYNDVINNNANTVCPQV